MIDVSKNMLIDLTKAIANPNTEFDVSCQTELPNDLLFYPNGKFVSPVKFDGRVVFEKGDVEVFGEIAFSISCLCDKCGTEIVKSFLFDFDEWFSKNPQEDDYAFDGSTLDMLKAVTDSVLLGLPSSVTCSDDCKGLCPKCGANLNVTQCGCNRQRENAFAQLKNSKF